MSIKLPDYPPTPGGELAGARAARARLASRAAASGPRLATVRRGPRPSPPVPSLPQKGPYPNPTLPLPHAAGAGPAAAGRRLAVAVEAMASRPAVEVWRSPATGPVAAAGRGIRLLDMRLWPLWAALEGRWHAGRYGSAGTADAGRLGELRRRRGAALALLRRRSALGLPREVRRLDDGDDLPGSAVDEAHVEALHVGDVCHGGERRRRGRPRGDACPRLGVPEGARDGAGGVRAAVEGRAHGAAYGYSSAHTSSLPGADARAYLHLWPDVGMWRICGDA